MDQSRSGRMAGRTVLVTGSGGIGRATAPARPRRARASHRPAGTAGAPRTRLARSAPPALARWTCSSRTCHPSREVRLLAGEALQRLPRIDVLVNNVGGYWGHRHVTADGLERTFSLSIISRRSCSPACSSAGESSTPARVVTVSSNVQALG